MTEPPAEHGGHGAHAVPPPPRVSPLPEDEARRRSERFGRISNWVTGIGLVLAAAFVVYGVASGSFRSTESLREFLGEFGIFAPLVFTVVQATQVVFPILPGGVGVIAAPVLFGPVLGTVCSYIGLTIGSICAFLIARRLGRTFIDSRFKAETVEKYLGWTSHRHFTAYFATAIFLPLAPDDLLCYIAGITNMRLRTFVVIMILGKPWGIMAYSFGVLKLLEVLFGWSF